MLVLLNTETHIDGREAMSDHLESVVNETLGHYGERIIRVAAYLINANGASKAGSEDIHCILEARQFGRDPVIAMDQAGTANQAIHGALLRLKRALASEFEKRDCGMLLLSRPVPVLSSYAKCFAAGISGQDPGPNEKRCENNSH